MWRGTRRAPQLAPNWPPAPLASRVERTPPTLLRRALWLLLPACASLVLLATTNHVCQDVAVVPFLWVAPLALYLLSFILCFDHPRWYVRSVWAMLALTLILAVSGVDFMLGRLGQSHNFVVDLLCVLPRCLRFAWFATANWSC